VVISGWILDPDRKKMSKSHGNVVTPEPLLDQYGADSVRYWAGRARLGVDTAYDEQVFKVGRKLCTKLFNASKFVLGRFEGIAIDQLGTEKITHETDRAMIAELRPMVEKATAAFEQFDYAQALSLTEDFFWRTFCDNYLELVKSRTYDPGLTPERLSAAACLRLVHRTLVRMFAPFLPYMCEEVWHWCYSSDEDMKDSVHQSPWPSAHEYESILPPTGERLFETALVVIDAIRKEKAEKKVSVKADVAKVIITASQNYQDSLNLVMDDICRMQNIQQVEWILHESLSDEINVQTVLEGAP
jgi:valyl-tRNA synthetase